MPARASVFSLLLCVFIFDFSVSREERNAMEIINQVNQRRGKRPRHVAAIQRAMRDWERDTCLKFVEKENNTWWNRGSYLRIIYGKGCYATVGRLWYLPSDFSLGSGCQTSSVATHELGHVIGFSHEHKRPDRDNYIEILWENIESKNLSPYRLLSPRYLSNYGVPYDYKSVMHYSSYEYSKNGKPTMKLRDPNIKIRFGSTRPTALDIQQANFMYNCPVYPKFSEDFTLQTTPHDVQICTTLNQTRDPDWVTRYLCHKPTIKKMNITWSRDGPIRGLECINTKMPLERASRYWDHTYLCVPRDELYRFYWSTNGPMRNKTCLKFRENRDGGYYLCAWKKHREVGGGWSSWSPWKQCDRKCGGGFQTKTRQCNNPVPASGGKTCAGASYTTRLCNQQNCPEWPHWPNDFRVLQQNFVPARFDCIKVYERMHYRFWRRVVFCWAKWKRPLVFKWSDLGPKQGMRCTRITEQEESSGWDNNYLCAAGDYPYQFTWSSRGPIRGLRCLQWNPQFPRRGWNDNYLCAREFPQPTKAPSTGCYSGWSSHQLGHYHYCYIPVFKLVTWEDARQECRDMKADLVSIGSQTEWDFVLGKLHGGQSVWLGLNDRKTEGRWVWSDGTPLTFTDWSRAEPSPEDRRENCAMSNVYTSKWNDYPCTSKFKFVCKRRGLRV